MSIRSVEETVDEAMGHLPRTLDLSDEAYRLKVRQWMVQVCNLAVQRNGYDFAKVAAKAVEEATRIAIDPDHYRVRAVRQVKKKTNQAVTRHRQIGQSVLSTIVAGGDN